MSLVLNFTSAEVFFLRSVYFVCPLVAHYVTASCHVSVGFGVRLVNLADDSVMGYDAILVRLFLPLIRLIYINALD